MDAVPSSASGYGRAWRIAAPAVILAALSAALMGPQMGAQAQNRAPATRTGIAGPLPLRSASATFDPDNDPLTFGWDLDNDGAFDEGVAAFARAAFSVSRDPRGASAPLPARLTFAVTAETTDGSLYQPPGGEEAPRMPGASRTAAIGWVNVPTPPGHTTAVDLKPLRVTDDNPPQVIYAVFVNGARVPVQTASGPSALISVTVSDDFGAVYTEVTSFLTVGGNRPVAATLEKIGADGSTYGVKYDWDLNNDGD